MAINPLLLNVKPVSELETVNNPTTGSLLFYDGGDKLKKTNVSDFYNAMQSAYLGIATTTTTPPATGAYWYKVDTAGTYTNFKDSSNAAIVVTTADLDGNLVHLEVTDNVAKKVVVALPANPSEVPQWVAGTYSAGKLVYNNGLNYRAKVTTSQEPTEGASDWESVGKVLKLDEKGGAISFDRGVKIEQNEKWTTFSNFNNTGILLSNGEVDSGWGTWRTTDFIYIRKGEVVEINVFGDHRNNLLVWCDLNKTNFKILKSANQVSVPQLINERFLINEEGYIRISTETHNVSGEYSFSMYSTDGLFIPASSFNKKDGVFPYNRGVKNESMLISSVALPKTYTTSIAQKFIDYSGNISQWGTATVYKVNLIENERYYYIDKLVNVAYPSIMIACYDSSDVYLGSMLSGTPDKTYTDILLDKNDFPIGTSYFAYHSTTDTGVPELYVLSNKVLDNRFKELESAVQEITEINVIGDSISSQIGYMLEDRIQTLDGLKINNKSVGGESVLDTLARNDIQPYIVEPFTIPAAVEASSAINVNHSLFFKTLIASDGETKTYINTYHKGEDGTKTNAYGEGINPWDFQKCVINGIKGTLYFKRSSPDRANNFFIRESAGLEVVLDAPQVVMPQNRLSKNSKVVCFMGTNGGWSPKDLLDSGDFNKNLEILVGQYKYIADYVGINNVLFLGFYMTAVLDQTTAADRIARWKYFENRMVAEFGNRYLSVRQYLREKGWKDAGYQLGYRLTSSGYTLLAADIVEDKQAIADGRIPYCVVGNSSGVHLTARASACVANQVAKRLFELGDVSELKQIDVSAISDGTNANINEPDYGG